MVALSSVGSEGHAELGELVRSARAAALDHLKARLGLAVAAGEIPSSVDIDGLARFVQTVRSGMSILARDGAGRGELEAVAQVAMLGWDARTGRRRRTHAASTPTPHGPPKRRHRDPGTRKAARTRADPRKP